LKFIVEETSQNNVIILRMEIEENEKKWSNSFMLCKVTCDTFIYVWSAVSSSVLRSDSMSSFWL
jgi:hypothetical protein